MHHRVVIIMMDKTVCELFAGVGGFRCGLNSIKHLSDVGKNENWKTVYFNQYEPNKKNQWAHKIYVSKFGFCSDKNGIDSSNWDISTVCKSDIPDHTLLVGGFPCQDYSVANHNIFKNTGIEGKKGQLWWDIADILNKKHPPFVLLENVDRIIRSPTFQRGRDFGIILQCFRNAGYFVQWRVINAAEYGFAQRRRRIFIFACHKSTNYAKKMEMSENFEHLFNSTGFFAKNFPVQFVSNKNIQFGIFDTLSPDISNSFSFDFENAGILIGDSFATTKTTPIPKTPATLDSIVVDYDVPENAFIPDSVLYYTIPNVSKSDETKTKLSSEQRHTFQYLKGAKRKIRKSCYSNQEYVYTEGPMNLVDSLDKPARTMLTSEGQFNRSTHLIHDKKTGKIRKLVPVECERINGFPDSWTESCTINGKTEFVPDRMRYFFMGNALVVGLVELMGKTISKIVDDENKTG